MKNESVKKSLRKSKNVLKEKHKIVKRKICKEKHTFTIIAMNFDQEQLIMRQRYRIEKLTKTQKTQTFDNISRNQLMSKSTTASTLNRNDLIDQNNPY